MKQRGRRLDRNDLHPTAYSPARVAAVRDLLAVSQGVFAKFLGVGVKTVSSWEQGVNTPSDMAYRFLDEIEANPNYWRKPLRDSARVKRYKVAR
jgi:DNA-binding transcriptional regulator YiaG